MPATIPPGRDETPENSSSEVSKTVTCPNCQTHFPVTHPEHGPNQGKTMLPTGILFVIAIVCGLYLVVPTLSVFELIPDAIPFIGSLDEAGATAGLLFAAGQLGWLEWLNLFRKKQV